MLMSIFIHIKSNMDRRWINFLWPLVLRVEDNLDCGVSEEVHQSGKLGLTIPEVSA